MSPRSMPLHSFTSPSGPRVVIENADSESAVVTARLLHQAGVDVAVCGGPDRMGSCPLLEDTDCRLADEADLILFDLDLEDATEREILASLLARYPDVPVVVEASTRQRRLYADVLDGAVVVAPYSPGRLVEVVVAQLHQRALV